MIFTSLIVSSASVESSKKKNVIRSFQLISTPDRENTTLENIFEINVFIQHGDITRIWKRRSTAHDES